MMHWADGQGWMHSGPGWLFMALFWALLISVVIALLRRSSSGGAGEIRKTPLEILRERYAKGEIGKDEFEQKRRDLEG